jgi:hypothetical protein
MQTTANTPELGQAKAQSESGFRSTSLDSERKGGAKIVAFPVQAAEHLRLGWPGELALDALGQPNEVVEMTAARGLKFASGDKLLPAKLADRLQHSVAGPTASIFITPHQALVHQFGEGVKDRQRIARRLVGDDRGDRFKVATAA